MKDIAPLKYKIQNIFADINDYGKLDFSKDEYEAMEKLEVLFKQEMKKILQKKTKKG